MDMNAGLLGYGGFVLTITLIAAIGYWQANELETWIKRIISKKKARGSKSV